MPRIAIIGAGVVGLATAWRLAARGATVDVFDAGPIPGGRPHAATWASAGLLAPSIDAHPGDRPLDALLRRAAAAWPAFAAELREASGIDVALRTEGTLVVALDAAAVAPLRASFEAHAAAAHGPHRWLDAAAVAGLEPGLAHTVAAARWSGADVQVDNRRLAAALAEAARRAGARLHASTPVTVDPPFVRGFDAVVLAAGAWTPTLAALPRAAAAPVRPVAGQMLALRMSPDAPLLRHVVVAPDVYMAPRADGRLLVGATIEERGFDAPVTAGAVHALLAAARRVLPAVDALPVAELWSGLRPGSPDDAPLIGWADDAVLVAAGHYRNGILLAPVTADAVAALALGEPAPDWLPAFAPDRFPGTSGP